MKNVSGLQMRTESKAEDMEGKLSYESLQSPGQGTGQQQPLKPAGTIQRRFKVERGLQKTEIPWSHKMNDESASPKKFTLRILESPIIIGIDLGANVIDNPGIL